MTNVHPDFIIIGAMKCGTSTLAAQLGVQPGIFMTDPKEPNFFSDDAQYARGAIWYDSLFSEAAADDLKGEASTHYTKLPTYPETIARLQATEIKPKLIYIIRNPIDRLTSHFIHEWTMRVIREDIETAISMHPELISYSCYGDQIAPYADAYGAENIHLIALETLKANPQQTLSYACRFLGHGGVVVWQEEQAKVNVSAKRIRRFPLHGLLIDNPVAESLRRFLIPQTLRDMVKRRRQMQDRPELSPESQRRLEGVFAQDYAKLRQLFPDRGDLDICYPFLNDE